MSSVVPKHMKTMCHTIIYKFVDPEITVPLNFNMAAGGYLGFSKMRVFCLKHFFNFRHNTYLNTMLF